MNETPDLSKSFNPVPKTYKAKKEPKPLKNGERTKTWNTGRKKLIGIFALNKVTKCEIGLEGCLKDNYLGFAHIERRINYTDEELIEPQHVVLACQPCHNTVDNEMEKLRAEKLLKGIVGKRKW